MKTKTLKYIPVFFLAAAAALSCVKEDGIDDCPPDELESLILYVDFSSHLYNNRESELQDEVAAMYVFVFDHDGYYIKTLVDENPAIGPDYSMAIGLDPGNYEFIGWSNLHRSFKLSDLDLQAGKTTVADLFIELDLDGGDTLDDLPDHLHYGLVREPSTKAASQQAYYMELDRYTNTINIVTEGLEPDQDDYLYVIGDRNGKYGFYSEDLSDSWVYYTTYCDKDSDGQLSASLRVLRLLEDHLDSTIMIENVSTGEALFDDFLIVRLLSMREQGEYVNFETKHEYTIKLIFSGRLLVAITIDGWIVYRHDDYEV
ncbi:MAG: FimB/Mfa2 family fimbrial subunit [Rikenellaceae bacterium]|nr:FimB/Mfa2 family fimbrial subunit [Rikenellaceae bacterium]